MHKHVETSSMPGSKMCCSQESFLPELNLLPVQRVNQVCKRHVTLRFSHAVPCSALTPASPVVFDPSWQLTLCPALDCRNITWLRCLAPAYPVLQLSACLPFSITVTTGADCPSRDRGLLVLLAALYTAGAPAVESLMPRS